MLNIKKTVAAAVCATALVAGAVAAPAIANDAPSAEAQAYQQYCWERGVQPTNDAFQNYKNAESIGAFYGNYGDTAAKSNAQSDDVQASDAPSAEAQAYQQYCWERGVQPTNDVEKNYENAKKIGAVEETAAQNNDAVVTDTPSDRDMQDKKRAWERGVQPTNDAFKNYENARNAGLAQ